MNKPGRVRFIFAAVCVLAVMTGPEVAAARPQREQQIAPPDQSTYSRAFFIQLRALFGRFRDVDLQRAFENARPIQCRDLVNDKGEWRTVAFFNEKRELGDWYRANFEEVKRDFSVFIFNGVCRGDHGPVQLTTRFPVSETVEAFSAGRVGLDEVEVNVNAPVRASFDPQSGSYAFDLPYLFLISRQDDQSIYSLTPPRLLDRERYATDVIDHWDCKSVTAENVTYQFLICRTSTVPRNSAERNAGRVAFGSSAYFILSDGKEASSNVRLSFTDDNDKQQPLNDAGVKVETAAALPASWETPDPEERLVDVLRDDFRIRFNPQTWPGRTASAQVLSGQQMTALASHVSGPTADSCIWLPGPAASLNEADAYSVTAQDSNGQASTSVVIALKAAGGRPMGALQCFFPRTPSAATLLFSRWKSIVGNHLVLEVRP